MDEDKVQIENFDGVDVGYRKMQLEDYFYQINLCQPFGGKKLEGTSDAD